MNKTSTTQSRSSNRNHEAALAAFLAKKAQIDLLLADLQSASDEHFYCDPDTITYANVGDLSHLLNNLQDLSDRLNNQGEYA